MQFGTFLSILGACGLAFTAPTPGELIARANTTPVSCGPSADQRAYPLQTVQEAFDALQKYGNMPKSSQPKAGTRAYPQQYGNNKGIPSDSDVVAALNAIPGCETGKSGFKYFEYPLVDPMWAGGAERSQGPDRVIAIAANIRPGETRSYTYCLSTTHRGGTGDSDPSFRTCPSAP
ncbi:hypothetical protein EV127DRAFT_490520 [Xylaria flabelliformis]|nr:hypothetical protein EV127DRAFT_490520 [Xylaria flabelliformis]